MQLIALEQLCMLLLMSDNVDRCASFLFVVLTVLFVVLIVLFMVLIVLFMFLIVLFTTTLIRCFESCPPRTFLPALCRIFLDREAPDQVIHQPVIRGDESYLCLHTNPICNRQSRCWR